MFAGKAIWKLDDPAVLAAERAERFAVTNDRCMAAAMLLLIDAPFCMPRLLYVFRQGYLEAG
jgi:hypothetical protein